MGDLRTASIVVTIAPSATIIETTSVSPLATAKESKVRGESV